MGHLPLLWVVTTNSINLGCQVVWGVGVYHTVLKKWEGNVKPTQANFTESNCSSEWHLLDWNARHDGQVWVYIISHRNYKIKHRSISLSLHAFTTLLLLDSLQLETWNMRVTLHRVGLTLRRDATLWPRFLSACSQNASSNIKISRT